MLEAELNFLQSNKLEWAKRYAGKFVLVKERELVGAFDTYEAALVEGAKRFHLQPFLVRPVDQPEREVSIPALELGLIRANPPHAV